MSGYEDTDRERWAAEPEKLSSRTDFERDRARVLHSASLRRLAAKTQVVSPGSDDFVRNRLTHSLEVAQVGRELGKALGCDPDVVDAACLAHDLGHPPFGHNGEEALDKIAEDIGGFEGNAQTLRLLTRLEAKAAHPDGRPAGLNLTRASLDAATKYPWPRSPAHPRKFGVYADDTDVFGWLRAGARDEQRCLEAQVMDFADDVAYCVHDVEDAIVGGWLEPWRVLDVPSERRRFAELTRSWYVPDVEIDEILETLDRLRHCSFWVDVYDGRRSALAALKDMTSQLIGRFSEDAQRLTHEAYGGGRLTRYAADLCVPRGTRLEVAVLKGLAATYVMTARDRAEAYGDQRALVEELVELLRGRAPEALEPTFREDWKDAPDDDARLRVVVDQVASLTDASAYLLHSRLRT
ncbi:deoxyguanosinetriphosphate triphosphohydrolase [Actinobacteria bacterium YIM 96077]|uniref:Deoxyguanosinetriphosphate triphosphohydrolase n=1 Tax=Phytoactinopolyspora halophila TaxID=1981511 RepID=A0A329QI11_9ACTN|nr:deoxyguanosinetriphosphate triphosphohydrolase [Phytoactinopolyspora halophila]AYY14045.1 deoxyguanosinetriphosphate triphosphohydrolase [Actinobacteria bacterium YIM 96077]RAW10952.1 deoxyguanosinetriphosphate triphosphohydrolase [Phytoactinopolyspora halophila]